MLARRPAADYAVAADLSFLKQAEDRSAVFKDEGGGPALPPNPQMACTSSTRGTQRRTRRVWPHSPGKIGGRMLMLSRLMNGRSLLRPEILWQFGFFRSTLLSFAENEAYPALRLLTRMRTGTRPEDRS
jgi:hypothetical protein